MRKHRFRHRHRHHRSRNVQVPIPSSTPQSLVFPYDPINQKFITSNYQAAQTQGRATAEEIEEFLKEVNVPIKAFYAEHSPSKGAACGMVCLLIICAIIFPLLPFLLCYLCKKGNDQMIEMKKASDRASIIIKSRGAPFNEKGLIWNIPAYFPRWIELWTQVGQYGQPVMQPIPTMQVQQQIQTFPTYQRPPDHSPEAIGMPGIQMQSVPQQNYQNGFGGVSNQV